MRLAWARRNGSAIAAVALVLVDFALRVALDGPYPGAAALLLAACGAVLIPLVPAALARPTLLVAAFPALALGSFTILVTTVSTLGIPLTETSIRASVAVFVFVGAAVGALVPRPRRAWSRSTRLEVAGVVAVLAMAAFSFASSWDIVGPFPPQGTDWGHYFLYADEVDRQQALLIDDPFAGRDGQVFGDPVMVGTLYGGVRILDGVSSRSFGPGAAVASAFSTMAIVAAAGGLWGVGAGLAGGAVYSVAPIRLNPMYWHGLGTALALVFLPFVVLALGLMFRGARDARTVALLGLALASGAAAHTTTTVVVALAVATAVALDALRTALVGRGRERFVVRWWRRGAVAPVLAGVMVAVIVGGGVVVHLIRQSRKLGDPVSYRFFEPDWLSWHTLDEYLTTEYLALAGVSLLVLVLWRGSRRDPALLAVAAVILASSVATQLWRIHFPYEYRRAVFPFGLALALLVGAAAARLARWQVVVPLGVVVCAYFAHESIGFRLPERLLSERPANSLVPAALDSVRERIDRGELPDTRLVVADGCLHFTVPYLLQRPSIAAFSEWQAGFENRMPAARQATSIVGGGPEGRRVAAELGAGYVVADPRCTPHPAPGLDGVVVARNEDALVLRLPIQ